MVEDCVEFVYEGSTIRAQEILTGIVACPGDLAENMYTCGIARKVEKNGDKLDGLFYFKDREILVTQMTDPSMECEMARASAYITELGGLTCHAARIANELNRLCIIGTGNAMQRIQDGDRLYLTYRLVSDHEGEDYRGVVYRECSREKMGRFS